ncbi:hypothetical protein SDC9_131242 [bioreactor metagenome]|uniref:Uncharacterized protein n=1 Tax=bioreactor metagenome TaxID=1076179 RepID=A0A645D4N6_9ZZZZ
MAERRPMLRIINPPNKVEQAAVSVPKIPDIKAISFTL